MEKESNMTFLFSPLVAFFCPSPLENHRIPSASPSSSSAVASKEKHIQNKKNLIPNEFCYKCYGFDTYNIHIPISTHKLSGHFYLYPKFDFYDRFFLLLCFCLLACLLAVMWWKKGNNIVLYRNRQGLKQKAQKIK